MPLGIKFLLGGLIIIILTAVWGDRKPWRKTEGTLIVFRRPLAGSLALGGLGLWLVLGPLLLLTESGSDKAPLFLLLFTEPLFCLVGGLMFCAAGLRCELSLDVQQQTYRFTSGWGLHPHVYSSHFEDFRGVFVRSPSGRSKSEQYSVGLTWKSGERRTPQLGISGKKQDMDALAAEMVTLGMPLVPAPAPETLRDLLRRRPTL